MSGAEESAEERLRRHRRRVSFDAVAGTYDEVRAGYPLALVDEMLRTAAVKAGDAVLEVGCGTGQLTRDLIGRGLDVTAIDPGTTTVATARRRMPAGVTWLTTTFEDFEAAPGSFALVVSATAFHWVDPEVRWIKAARLLQPGGWLALLGTGERYDDPLGSALRGLWVRLSESGQEWTQPAPTLEELMEASGLFEASVSRRVVEQTALSPEHVLKLEQTRATVLTYSPGTRAQFVEELAALLAPLATVPAERHTSLTMARVQHRP